MLEVMGVKPSFAQLESGKTTTAKRNQLGVTTRKDNLFTLLYASCFIIQLSIRKQTSKYRF